MNAEFFPNKEKDIETLLHDIKELGYKAEILNDSVAVKVEGREDFYELAEKLYNEVKRNNVTNVLSDEKVEDTVN